MKPTTRIWWHRLWSTVISGGAGAVTSTVTASMLAPEQFNLGPKLGHFFELALATFIVNGLLGMMLYLSKSPLPEDSEDEPATKMDRETAGKA